MARQAALYVTHGGGPMPLIGAQPDVAAFLKGASKLLPQRPKAIVCVTAHWETSVPTVSTHPAPPMLYDYGGFPDEAYSIKYPAPGDPELARKILQLLRDAGFPAKEDDKRGYDHGTFVPLYLMFPKAEIPVVQVSVMSSMDPTMHVKMGEALASLRDENVLILGSGSSFHNMQLFFSRQGSHANVEGAKQAKTFDDYLNTALCSSTPEKRIEMLEKWAEAPGGQLSHPREEHLIPLHVVVGAAGQDAGKLVHQTEMNGLLCSSWVFSA